MTLGPGKYDDICTSAREQAGADGVVLIVIGGKHGNGFSVQADVPVTLALPDLLEVVARDLRADIAGVKP